MLFYLPLVAVGATINTRAFPSVGVKCLIKTPQSKTFVTPTTYRKPAVSAAMAYRRSSRRKFSSRSRRPTRSYGRKRTSTNRRSTRRKPAVKRMSTRSLLNRTSQKKRDTMLTYTNVDPSSSDPELYTKTAATMTGLPGKTWIFGWMPSARPAETSSAQRGSKIDIALRTAHTIFARGTKENLILRTNSSVAWEWRRVTFMVKDFFDTLDVNSSGYFRQVSGDGMVRLIREIPNGDILQAMFRGARNSDWLDEMNAPIDTEKVDLKSDVRRVIRSGNDSATVRHINHWYPINKNITYRDDEEGESMFLSPVSTAGKRGAGDYYIMDFFRAIGGAEGDELSMLSNATFYWHEK